MTAHDNGDGTGTLSYTQYRISPHWQRGKSLSTLERPTQRSRRARSRRGGGKTVLAQEPQQLRPSWRGSVPSGNVDGTFRWTTPSGRTYTTEPTRYPI